VPRPSHFERQLAVTGGHVGAIKRPPHRAGSGRSGPGRWWRPGPSWRAGTKLGNYATAGFRTDSRRREVAVGRLLIPIGDGARERRSGATGQDRPHRDSARIDAGGSVRRGTAATDVVLCMRDWAGQELSGEHRVGAAGDHTVPCSPDRCLGAEPGPVIAQERAVVAVAANQGVRT